MMGTILSEYPGASQLSASGWVEALSVNSAMTVQASPQPITEHFPQKFLMALAVSLPLPEPGSHSPASCLYRSAFFWTFLINGFIQSPSVVLNSPMFLFYHGCYSTVYDRPHFVSLVTSWTMEFCPIFGCYE